uniref:UPAR/Ly6 domain-containing protein n=1 Tax=Oryctolagus cuniculus TaxID=9986 RepID=U3KML4_RABIT
MRPVAIAPRLLLACSLALGPLLAVSWEIQMRDLEEKDVDEFSSSGFKCPTCIAVQGRKCHVEFKWCAADQINCFEFLGIINTGISNMTIKVKKCIRAELCKEMITSYVGFPVTNGTRNCKSAIKNGARGRPAAPIFLVLFLGKLLH